MSLLQNSNAISTGGAYNITDSLRLRSSASAYLSRTPTTAGSTTTGTISTWFKIGSNTGGILFEQGDGTSSNRVGVWVNTTNSVIQGYVVIGGTIYSVISNAVLRDYSAWYHVVLTLDTTNSTAGDRLRLYLNGERIPLATDQASSITQNQVTQLNGTGPCRIGYNQYATSYYFDGYMTEFNLVDGQALTPSDFGETNADGVWSPKKYTGTYGTNGFYLPMKETTQATGFNTVLYTGTGATQSITGVGFSPDLVWTKSRSVVDSHNLYDTVRGATKRIATNSTNAEDTVSGVSSFDSDGFTLGSGAGNGSSSGNFVAWCWDAGSSTVSNTDGTITSSVRANPATGFSIVTYTGNGTAGATVGHGLGSVPDMLLIKDRSSVRGWLVYHSANTAAPETDYVLLNTTDATLDSVTAWNDTAPTSSVFSLGTGQGGNASGNNFVAYCFSEVAGFSKFGSYTGNGSTSGPTITTGFRPAFVMWKRTDVAGESWYIVDSTRDPDNNPSLQLRPNLTDAETSTTNRSMTFTDTGFQVTGNDSSTNASGGTYIYMAFADTRDFQWNFDASGNKNNWTPNNINSNASSETTYDLMSDVPSLADEDTANFAVLNPLDKDGSPTFANANLQVNSGAVWSSGISSLAMTQGKWYAEFHATSISFSYVGLAQEKYSFFNGTNLSAGVGYANSGLIYVNDTDTNVTGSTTSYASYTTGDVLGVAYDADSGKVYIHKNGTWLNSGNPVSGTGQIATVTPSRNWRFGASTYNSTINANFGQRPFKYTPPTGYKKLNTFNLPDSSITDGSQYMNTVLWTGNGGTQSITGVGFEPDLVWVKRRDSAGNHAIHDSVRGASGGEYYALFSDSTSAEQLQADGDGLLSLDSDGFGLGYNNSALWNASGGSYVGWSWRASDSTAVSNTDGTITSTVSANTTSGFSVVTYTGNGTTATVGHGLGVAPKIYIIKSRSLAQGWLFYTTVIDGSLDFLALNTTDAKSDSSISLPNSTTFGVTSANTTGASGQTYVAYCFADVEGFSKFGKYTGNGSADGPFVYTGFRPAFVMIKCTSNADSWYMLDTSRSTYNATNHRLFANASSAESSGDPIDILSNGFKNRSNTTLNNLNGGTYIYMAFAENPFKNSLAR